MKALLLFFTSLACLSGCAFHQSPYIMYQGSVPLTETSVLAAFDESTNQSIATIRAVDGRETPCF